MSQPYTDDIKATSHYDKISSVYNHMYKPIHEAALPVIIKKLNLRAHDVLVDIGGGTGQTAHMLWTTVGMREPVTCVEPCPALYQQACQLDGVSPIMSTAEEFFSTLVKKMAAKDTMKSFNKIVMVEVLHHFSDRQAVFSDMVECLPQAGSCLMLMREQKPPLPLPRLQLKHFAESAGDRVNEILAMFEGTNTKVEVSLEDTNFCIPKSTWYNMIRSRFLSSFQRYSDEELEAGIKELEMGKFKGTKCDECITVEDQRVAILITKL